MKEDTSDRTIIRWPEVHKLTGYSRSTIFQLEKAGEFPQRLHLGPRAVGWYRCQVIAWQEQNLRGEAGAIPGKEPSKKGKHKRRLSATGQAGIQE